MLSGRSWTSLVTGVLCALLMVACDADTSTSPAPAAPSDRCAPLSQRERPDFSRHAVYAAGIEKRTEDGDLRVVLIESSPIPKDTGLYTWVVEVQNAQCEPIEGASVVAEPTMPSHGHGTSPPPTSGVSLDAAGRLELTDMDLFMPGIWEVTLTVILEGESPETVRFNFDLEG